MSESFPAADDGAGAETPGAVAFADWARVVDTLGEAVIAASADDVIVHANPPAEALLGWERGGLIGQALTAVVPERFRRRHLAAFERFVDEGGQARTLQVPALRRDGTEVPVEVVLTGAALSGERVVIGNVRDVSDRVEVEGAGFVPDLVLAAVAEERTLDEAIPRVLEALGASLNWELVQLWMVDESGEELRLRSHWLAPGVEAGPFVNASRRTFRRGDVLPGRVWERGRAEWVADFGAEPSLLRREAAASSGLRAAFAFPVVAGRRILGVIELISRKPREASPELFSRLALLGTELGYFVERRTIEEERLAAHEALRLQTALLQTQSESGLEGQLVFSPQGQLVSLNRRFAEMWGLSDDFLERGSGPEALALAAQWLEDPDAFLAGTSEAQARRQTVRDEIVLRDGRVFDRYGAPLVADGGYLGYAWYFRDVTDQKRIERELVRAGERSAALARTLQQSLLPPELPSVRGLDVAARYHPAGAGLDVGGDFYDVFRTRRGSVGIAIGDVCGKGAPAASLTALVRYTLRTAAMQTRSPAQALSIVNAAMIRQQPEEGAGKFATVAYAALQRSRGVNTLTVSSGGHPLPLVRRRDGTIETAARPGTLLGLFPTVQLHDHSLELESGDAVVFFTDGVIEARAGADFFGEERVRAVLGHTVGWSATDIAAAIETAAFAFQGGDTGDDIAVLVIALR